MKNYKNIIKILKIKYNIIHIYYIKFKKYISTINFFKLKFSIFIIYQFIV